MIVIVTVAVVVTVVVMEEVVMVERVVVEVVELMVQVVMVGVLVVRVVEIMMLGVGGKTGGYICHLLRWHNKFPAKPGGSQHFIQECKGCIANPRSTAL